MAFQKAVKEQVKLRLAIDGLAGSGKSFSSLAIASAMAKMMREYGHGEGRIAVIDSERGSARLYADKFDFDVSELSSFSPLAYADEIHEAERAGYDIIIADSISHAWAGKDGALDQKDKAAGSSGNSWTAWRNVTPKHNALVDAMLQCKAHFIATMRVKMEYVQEKNDKGQTEIKKVGLAAIQREGMEYEFTLVGDIDHSHTMKIAKSRVDGIGLGDQFERPGESFARRVYSWLTSGAKPAPRPVAQAPKADAVNEALDATFTAYLSDLEKATSRAQLDEIATGANRPAKGTKNYDIAKAKYLEIADRIEKGAAA